MPRIKRYGPLAHGFNRDPELRDLRQKYADWMGYVWMEMCLIADLNGGEVKGTPEQIGASLAYISLTKRPSLAAKCITNALGFMEVCGWIEIQHDRVLILKYWKYHPSESRDPVPTNERTKRTNEHKIQIPPSVDSAKAEKRNELDPRIKIWSDKIFAIDEVKFSRLIQWITAALRTYDPAVVAITLEKFFPYAAGVKEGWWGYIDKILDKEEGKFNARNAELASEEHKDESLEAAESLFGRQGLGQPKRG